MSISISKPSSLLLLSLLPLAGCDSSASEPRASDRPLIPYVQGEATFSGYFHDSQTELLYGYESLYFAQHDGDWSSFELPRADVYSAAIVGPDHWLFSVAGDSTYDEEGNFTPLLETKDAGLNWQYRSVEVENSERPPEVMSALAYDHDGDRLYAAVGGDLIYSTSRGETFELLSEHSLDGRAVQLILNPARDELWWFGALNLVSGGGAPDDTLVRRYSLSPAGEVLEVSDLSDEIPLDSVRGALINNNDANQIFIAGRSGVVRSDDGGESWQIVYPGHNVANIVQSSAGSEIFTAFTYDGYLYIACSTDAGDNWTEYGVAETPDDNLLSMFERSGNSLLVGFTYAGAYRVNTEQVSCL